MKVCFVKSIDPTERGKLCGDNDDESDEFIVGTGDDADEELGWRVELDGVLNDELIELLLSNRERGGGGGAGVEDISWNEVFEYNAGLIWFVGDDEVGVGFTDNEKCFRRVGRLIGDSTDSIGAGLSFKSISLNTSDIVLFI